METTFNRWSMMVVALIPLAFGCASSGSTPTSQQPNQTSSAVPEPSKVELVAAGAETAELGSVYFETDRSALEPEVRVTLRRYALSIQQHPEWGVITIEGHCDERGSDEYNLALGQRRANAVATYLVDLGVSSNRLKTRTYGEARPAVMGHGEAFWRENRRSELSLD